MRERERQAVDIEPRQPGPGLRQSYFCGYFELSLGRGGAVAMEHSVLTI